MGNELLNGAWLPKCGAGLDQRLVVGESTVAADLVVQDAGGNEQVPDGRGLSASRPTIRMAALRP